MKTSILILFISCILFSLSSNIFPTTAQTTLPDPVLDTTGQPLRRGTNYNILPANRDDGGGLTLSNGQNGSCPYEIVQTLNKGNGLPLTFSPVDNDTIIRLTTDQNIRFVDFLSPKPCPESKVWRLGSGNETRPPLFVMTGGVEGNPGRQTLGNWFKIEKYEDAYLIEYCPSVPCQPCSVLCGNIGIYVENARRRLAINQPPFKIVFKKA